MNIVTILRSGHWPSLAGAWLHLTISFMVWLMVGAMSIPLVRDLDISEQETAWLIALPLLGGAVCRVVAGWSADWIGARRTAVAILVAEVATLLWGWLGVEGYQQAVLFAACLGIAGASFAVALPIAGRAYPPTAQGFVLGLAASGNIGTVLILFLAPRWTMTMSWHGVCGLMAGVSVITLVVFLLLVPVEGPRQVVGSARWWHHAAGLIRRRTAYWLCFLYAVTFGGFVGLCSVLPLLVHDVYKMEAVQAGALAAVCGLVGSLVRPLGGYVADKHGGLRTLYIVMPVVAGSVVAVTSPSLFMAVSMMVIAAGAMGFGNGVVFQLVAEWFPKDIGLASGIVGAVGSLGGFGLPIIMGTVKGFTGTYELGLWIFAGFAIGAWGTVLIALRGLQAGRTEP